jgi:perosamine synthetase
MPQYIPQYEPSFDYSEAKALYDYMNSGGWVTEFKKTKVFEDLIADYTGAKYAFAVNNGTVAITLAAMACGIVPGNKVLVPNYTMIATPNSLRLFGAIPVFVDVEPSTLCMDIDKAKEKLDSDVKGVIFVPANGRYPEKGIEEFIGFARNNGIALIEDAAQGLGSYYPNRKHLGMIGNAGTLSFSSPKIVTTGQGGMILTDDAKISDRIKKLKDFGRSRGGMDIHDSIGYNFKFTDIQAVVGIAQMAKLANRIKRKKRIFQLYQDGLKSLDPVSLFYHDTTFTTPWFIDARVHDRDGLKTYLAKNHIGTRDMYPPINAQKAYNLSGNFPVSEEIGLSGLWLPSHPQLTDEDILYICETIKEYYTTKIGDIYDNT